MAKSVIQKINLADFVGGESKGRWVEEDMLQSNSGFLS